MSLVNLTEEDVARLLTYRDLVPLMERALSELSSGDAIQPVRQMLPVEPERRYLGMMPAVTSQAMGAKLVCFYPANAGSEYPTHLASILLFDPQTGQPLAVMDGRLITEMRTAATSAAVSRRLASPESSRLALIGSGVQAEAHLQALREIFPIDEVRVWSRTQANARAFADRHGAQAMALQQAVEGADIVVVATNSTTPVVQGAWLKAGAHVNSVGSPRPTWRELDDAVMANALVVDSREAAMTEAGDVILSGAEILAEAGELFAGRVQIDPGQTTVFKSVGVAVEDLAAARHVYDAYLNQ
ncbi:ornithine cyclodeaminase family protein [Paracoccus seriniphilus]|uniref:Thiomorpholine-carboxylate dehydrogenase n=1 Tax=Paracoccus seriniphilus TaxID=184748 RepID=A0A239PZD7_9RHOB|nr:ornithine cyclodeaminase family protein [Paracoccus seriniphilus]WCR15689.1 ornithine cyclodeaminase family protein [Paracoccus seriniphilus]SNT75634.1 thiomorpholine-carboxylate dehydrogenase [Paracoccus seriniphilus]